MDVREFDFDLPSELIAQEPAAARGTSRLLHLDRRTGALTHTTVDRRSAAGVLDPGDVVVVNNTRVFPARLLGRRVPSGGAVECLLIGRAWPTPRRPVSAGDGEELAGAHASRAEACGRARASSSDRAAVDSRRGARAQLSSAAASIRLWTRRRRVPIDDASMRSATCRSRRTSSATIVLRIASAIRRCSPASADRSPRRPPVCTSRRQLNASLARAQASRSPKSRCTSGTGRSSRCASTRVEDHRVEAGAVRDLRRSRRRRSTARADEGRRVVAVGTTTTRTLEAVAAAARRAHWSPATGTTDLFIYPGLRRFASCDGLLTNFHLPRSSLLMLVSAFGGHRPGAGRRMRRRSPRGYRFYSYGDAMLIT